MTREQLLKNLELPEGLHDAILDTDTYNEVDDQFALAYMLRSSDRIRTRAVYAAPFFNRNSESPEDGMEKSYAEIFKVLELCGRTDLNDYVFKGSPCYLKDESTPVTSPAALHLAGLAKEYSPENPLYVIAIGAITNVASALLLEPAVAENCVVVWLGGHSHTWPNTKEFNMVQDIAAARVVFSSGVPVVTFPCMGVVEPFSFSRPELEAWFLDKNPLSDYLGRNVLAYWGENAAPTATKTIWDVTAIAWLACKSFSFDVRPVLLPDYNGLYDREHPGQPCAYVYHINKAKLAGDLVNKIVGEQK